MIQAIPQSGYRQIVQQEDKPSMRTLDFTESINPITGAMTDKKT